MSFSGDSSTKKRVDLGGRSSKERDRQKLLEKTKLERDRRALLRQQNSAALKIQKYFRGRKIAEAVRCQVRKRFFLIFGDHCQNVDRHCFGPGSDFLRQLLFFFNPKNTADVSALVETCQLLQKFVQENAGDVLSLIASTDYSSKCALVDYRVKKLVFACIQAIYENRIQLTDQLIASKRHGTPAILLLQAVHLLIDDRLPWACNTVSYLLERNVLSMFRSIILTLKKGNDLVHTVDASSLERILAIIISHVGQGSCACQYMDTRWSFSSQILTIPFLWRLFPQLKEMFVTPAWRGHCFHEMALCVKDRNNLLFDDISNDFPGYACLIGNFLEVAGDAFAEPESVDMARDCAIVTTSLFAIPPIRPSNEGSKQNGAVGDDEMIFGDERADGVLNRDLEQQIYNAMDPGFFLVLTTFLLGGYSVSDRELPDDNVVAAVGAACAFLHVAFNILPLDRFMTVLGYRKELVPVFWNFVIRFDQSNMWPSLSRMFSYLPEDAPDWLVHLAVFFPADRDMLTIVDNEEFYDQEKPLRLEDIRCLIVILRRALWQLLRLSTKALVNFSMSSTNIHTTSEFLSQSQLAALMERYAPNVGVSKISFTVQIDHSLEDALGQLDELEEWFLRGQTYFRRREIVEAERHEKRERFFMTFGDHCQNVDRQCFGPHSDFLRDLLFFFNPKNTADVSILVETCRLLQKFVQENAGDVLSLFSSTDNCPMGVLMVNLRVRELVFACIRAIYENRIQLRDELIASKRHGTPAILLLEAVHLLIDHRLPWDCFIVSYLLERNVLSMFRSIILTLKKVNILVHTVDASSLERILAIIISHVGRGSCACQYMDARWSFSSQILTIPFLWRLFPQLKEMFVTPALSRHYFHQMALCVEDLNSLLFRDISNDFPGYACLLGNVLEVAGVAFAQPGSFDMAIDFAIVTTSLLEAIPPIRPSNEGSKQNGTVGADEMISGDERADEVLNRDLELQIYNAIDPRFLLQLTNVLLGGVSLSDNEAPNNNLVAAVSALCGFLHATFNILPLEHVMRVLAYRTVLVPVLWNFMKRFHESSMWSSLSRMFSYLPEDAPGCLLPLAVFCPVYNLMLTIVDDEEFYHQEKPLRLDDIRCLIGILKKALLQLLRLNSAAPTKFSKSSTNILAMKQYPIEFLWHRACVTTSELLSQLQDRNTRRQFIPPSDFHAGVVDEDFINQAMTENTEANDILKLAPFLVPFTCRAKIFTSQLAAMKVAFSRIGFRIRRDHIWKDAFDQWNALTNVNLRGQIRISFVNEFGVEEAGIDGGGIFKDFMESVTRAAFDVQYGLFKETADHHLYPNPESGLVHDMHRQLFYTLGTVLAKAMFEGILVGIPFAKFFLSKLKQKDNYLHDLPSLDPQLYENLISLKHYEGDISDLELYFSIVNGENGKRTEEELLPGGKNVRVTKENVFEYIHLVAHHRLNLQIREQSYHFLMGFQQLIPKERIDMFNEHELQLLISGSDGFDIDDLRANTKYIGGYRPEHHVVEMFWEVIESFSLENQRKLLTFVTGCSRGPLLGFRHLKPLFCIQRVAGLERLPTAATCFNRLKLPPYGSKEQMEQKLLYAINAEARFDLP